MQLPYKEQRLKRFSLYLALSFLCATALGAPSPSGTLIPPATSIVDSAGRTWVETSTKTITVNGKAAGYTANVKGVLYYSGGVYQTNEAGGWWKATVGGTAAVPTVTWILVSDPRPAATLDGWILAPNIATGTIVDGAKNMWALNPATKALTLNGVQVGTNAIAAMYSQGTVYELTADFKWWKPTMVGNTVSGWTACPTQ